MLTGGGQFDKVDNRGPQDGLGHAAGADCIRGNNLACAGAQQLFLGAFFTGPGQDEELRIQSAGREGNVDVIRI